MTSTVPIVEEPISENSEQQDTVHVQNVMKDIQAQLQVALSTMELSLQIQEEFHLVLSSTLRDMGKQLRQTQAEISKIRDLIALLTATKKL